MSEKQIIIIIVSASISGARTFATSASRCHTRRTEIDRDSRVRSHQVCLVCVCACVCVCVCVCVCGVSE